MLISNHSQAPSSLCVEGKEGVGSFICLAGSVVTGMDWSTVLALLACCLPLTRIFPDETTRWVKARNPRCHRVDCLSPSGWYPDSSNLSPFHQLVLTQGVAIRANTPKLCWHRLHLLSYYAHYPYRESTRVPTCHSTALSLIRPCCWGFNNSIAFCQRSAEPCNASAVIKSG